MRSQMRSASGRNTALLMILTWFSCSTSFPPSISDTAVKDLGVSEGVAGTVSVRTGTCTQGCGFECYATDLEGEVWAVSPDDLPGQPSSTCTPNIGIHTHKQILGLPFATLDAGVFGRGSIQGDKFGIQLDAGSYRILIVDDAGCVLTDAPSDHLVEVQPGQVTKIELYSTWATQ